MNIINIANKQTIKNGDNFYYKIDNFGVFKLKVYLGVPNFGSHPRIMEVKIINFNSFYKEDYFKSIINENILGSFSVYLGINSLNKNENLNEQINALSKNKVITFDKFIKFTRGILNSFDTSFNYIINLNKAKYDLFNSFKFFKDDSLNTYEDILKTENVFVYDINLFKNLKDVYNFKNNIENDLDNFKKIKLNTLKITYKYFNHPNCCGFSYLSIKNLKIKTVSLINNEEIANLINFIFFNMLSNNRSIMVDLPHHIPQLIEKFKQFKQVHQITNKKFLIHL